MSAVTSLERSAKIAISAWRKGEPNGRATALGSRPAEIPNRPPSFPPGAPRDLNHPSENKSPALGNSFPFLVSGNVPWHRLVLACFQASGETQSDASADGDLEARKSGALIGLIRWNRTTSSMRPNPQERRCPAPGSHVGIATERFDQAGEAVRSEKSLGRLQPRLVGSLRKCEEEAFAQVTVAYTIRFAIPVLGTSLHKCLQCGQSIEAPRMSTGS